jgi:hypothetical protein
MKQGLIFILDFCGYSWHISIDHTMQKLFLVGSLRINSWSTFFMQQKENEKDERKRKRSNFIFRFGV